MMKAERSIIIDGKLYRRGQELPKPAEALEEKGLPPLKKEKK